MLVKTRGVVFHQLKYSETSLIVKIYTEEFGIQSYLVKGARTKKSRISTSLFQPLSLVELVAYRKEKNNLHHIKEIKSLFHYTSISTDIIKSSICIFVNELLYRSIREEEANPALFEFIFSSMRWLDLISEQFYNFHLVFAMHLSKYLGFFPRGIHTKTTPIFNLTEGCFENNSTNNHLCIEGIFADLFSQISNSSFENMSNIKMNGDLRTQLAEKIVIYYQHHLANFEELKSLEVLKAILS